MRLSRIVTGLLAIAGVTSIAANPGCSSSSKGSGFTQPVDAGHDGGLMRGPDGAIIPPADAPVMLKTGMDAGGDAPKMKVTSEGGFNDAKVTVDATGCVEDAGGPAPLLHTCIIWNNGMPGDDNNECDGHHDPPAPFPANGSMGNGFDDNCNGLVDEGCACVNVGTTKPCYLVPATQTEQGLPVGWCATNSVGTVACAQQGESGAEWSGVCRGAQPPYANDVCAPGDFNCDGKPENAPGGCACKSAPIVCPTAPLTTVPYPPPTALPLEVNAGTWFSDPSQVPMATNWQWSMTGGDCDNILPNPTFALYPSPNGSGAPVGTTSTTLGMSMKEHGTVATGAALGATPSIVYPAFALSGDYILTASWELNGQPYTCTVQIDVRAPGLRAEACWSTEGQGDDLDLHMAKATGFSTKCPNKQGWSDNVCPSANEDCYYADCYTSGSGPYASSDTVNWGDAKSPAASCNGWGSQTTGGAPCGNPRLDRDANGLSGICNASEVNPNGAHFCGPENINIDNPSDGDEYAVAVRFYARHGTPAGQGARTHADIYCNGARILAAGYDPLPGPTGLITSLYPQLITQGEDGSAGEGGDMWKVALVTTSTGDGGELNCTVVPTQSMTADPSRDGTTAYCVDNAGMDGANSQILLTSSGGVPANANALCYH
jgi:hypothetical protein